MSRNGAYQIIDIETMSPSQAYELLENNNNEKPVLVSGIRKLTNDDTTPNTSWVKNIELLSTSANIELINGTLIGISLTNEVYNIIDFNTKTVEATFAPNSEQVMRALIDLNDLPLMNGLYEIQIAGQLAENEPWAFLSIISIDLNNTSLEYSLPTSVLRLPTPSLLFFNITVNITDDNHLEILVPVYDDTGAYVSVFNDNIKSVLINRKVG